MRYVDPDGRVINVVIGAAIGFISSVATEIGSRMIEGQSFTDALCNTFTDATSLAVIGASTAIGAVTSGVSGMAVNAATKSVTSVTTVTAKAAFQAVGKIAVNTTAINIASGAVDAGVKDIAVKAIKGEQQTVSATAMEMVKGGISSALFSGVTESVIASGCRTSGQIENVLTGTLKDFTIHQPKWAGTVGNIGENVIPTGIDLGKEVNKIYGGKYINGVDE